MGRKNKGGKELAQTKDQTPLLPLSGSRKVVRTPTNPFEAAGTIEVFVPKEIIARRIQQILRGPNKGRKADHYLVVWEGYPLKKDYTWEPIENLSEREARSDKLVFLVSLSWLVNSCLFLRLVQQLNVCLVSQV